MTPTEESTQQIGTGDLGTLEDDWLTHLDKAPTDVEYFLAAAEKVPPSADDEILKSLLRLLDEELVACRAWSERLAVLSRLGGRFLRPNALHEAATESLRELYADSTNLDEMMRIAGLHQATQSERKLVQQIDRMHSLMELDEGRLVRMEGKGVGRILEINFELGSYKVDFEQHGTITVGFRAGAKHLQPLPEGHILRRTVEEPERLEQLRDEAPSELLRAVLVSYDEPLPAADVRRVLTGIVSSAQWSRWWNAARNHPQVVVTTDKRQRYSWADSQDDATQEVWSAFEAGDLAERLALFLKNARQNPELARDMRDELDAKAEASVASEPARALEIWHVLSRAGLADDDRPYSPRQIVERTGADLPRLVEQLSQRPLRELVYAEIRAVRPDWSEIFERCAASETEPALVGQLAGSLREEDSKRYNDLISRISRRPNEHPGAFVWLVTRAQTDDDLRRRFPLRLFKQLLVAISDDTFSAYKATIEPQLESGGTLPKLMADLTEDEAAAAAKAVERALLPGYLRSSLVTALETRFESLRSDTAHEALYATPESIERRKQEFRQLKETEIPAARAAVQEAAALGDLRENFEYKSARQRFEYLSARVATLEADLSRVRPIEIDRIGEDEVRIGASLELEGGGERRQLTVLGPWESAPENGIISYQSDLGGRLLGKTIGDPVELEGGSFEIVAIRPYADAW